MRRRLEITPVILMFSLVFGPIIYHYAYALTDGPTQPEFSSFEPVTTTNMVNEFTGDFTYNLPILEIPGPHGSGYALSLSYHSGASPEDEASWVGYGWTLNPGAIVRNRRGFPDDYDGNDVIYWNKVPKNWTVSVGHSVGLEAFSIDSGLGVSTAIRYNNYKGFGLVRGVSAHVKGIANLGYSVEDGEGSFSASINPAGFLSRSGQRAKYNENNPQAESINKSRKWSAENRSKWLGKQILNSTSFSLTGSRYGILSHSEAVRATNTTKYAGDSHNFSVSVTPTGLPVPVGPSAGLLGNYTCQENLEKEKLRAYGYMYSGYAEPSTSEIDIMDYYLEKETPYQKRDKFLAIPFSNADNFAVTGEGIVGNFRLYNKRAGHFRPTAKESKMDIHQLGVEVLAGSDVGLGSDIGIGYQELKVGGWGDIDKRYEFVAEGGDEPYFFRFNNDLGGNVNISADDEAVNAKLEGGGLPGLKSYTPLVPEDNIWEYANNNVRIGRSSYIAYHTNEEMAKTIYSSNLDKGVVYRSYTKDEDSRKWVKRHGTGNPISRQIGEFIVFNEDGQRYVYGLPVYSRNESNLQYGLRGVPPEDIVDNYLAYRVIPVDDDIPIKVGEERPVPYATMYLLTEITTPDYVDRTLDGPTPDDFGGYTKFNYTQVCGTPASDGYKTEGDNWYRWRIPYTGLLYDRNELSDPEDDVGVVMAGEKEIYYLESIETKTHIAQFEISDRQDGIDAAENAEAAKEREAKGSRTLKKLDKIRLYAKDKDGNPGRLLKTVRFNYDHSLMKGLPNATSDGVGKLTLKKVWFEYEDIVNAGISPYVFGYEYKTSGYPTKYSGLVDIYGEYSEESQNPEYNPLNIDRWGNYQYNGSERHSKLNPWVSQNPNITQFDPAAWQLKWIRLPSKGEIHVQYEQDDYSYVQSRPAMAMVSLRDVPDEDENKYYLSVADLGVGDTDTEALLGLRSQIENELINKDEKIYFKFLYALIGSDPDLNKCNSEYVSGYVDVHQVGVDENGLFMFLKGEEGALSTPKKICEDLVKTSKSGKLNDSGDCNASISGIPDGDDISEDDIEELVMTLVAKIGTDLGFTDTCREISYPNSYVRIPLTGPKKGGGIRVKRLLMFDKGLEDSDAALYGNEYIYQTLGSDGEVISSGVATTEPSKGRQENALVTHLPRYSQDWLSRIIAGEDKKQVEGPIGESILPAPSVGYSKVIVRNIHSGLTNPGLTVKEFYTARGYPFDKHYHDEIQGKGVEQTPINEKSDFLLLPLGLITRNISNLWLTQGFRFIINSMHGQRKAVATYDGSYSAIHDPSQNSLISKQEYSYFEPGQRIPMMNGLSDSDIIYESPGKEMEVVFETKTISDISNDFSIEGDASLGLAGIFPIPYVTAFPSFQYNESKLSAHVTTKVIVYPAMLKRIRTIQDGRDTTIENVAFDPDTGRPILTRAFDGYHSMDLALSPDHDGSYHKYTIPASQKYEPMGQKALNEGIRLHSNAVLKIEKVFDGGEHFLSFSATEGTVCEAMELFSAGDLVEITGYMKPKAIYHVGEKAGNRIELIPTYAYDNHNDLSYEAGVEIIRSGRANQLTEATGTINTYGEKENPVLHTIPLMAARRQLAEELTTLLPSGGLIEDLPINHPEITILDEFGECSTPDGICRISVQVDDSKTTLTYKCGDSKPCEEDLSRSENWAEDRFGIDEMTGQLVYYRGDAPCFPVAVRCIQLCPQSYSYETLDGVVDVDTQTYDDEWDPRGGLLGQVYDIPNSTSHNMYEIAAKGKWRPRSSYAYLTDIVSANHPGGRVYKDAGVFSDFILFNWQYEDANDIEKWLNTNTITKYSPNGDPLEDRNIREIYSVAKFGYHHAVPYLVTQNADYGSVLFESFEYTYEPAHYEDGLVVDVLSGFKAVDDVSHAGHKSIKTWTIFALEPKLRLRKMELTDQLQNPGFSVKMWVKLADTIESLDETLKLSLVSEGGVYWLETSFSRIAKTGEWTLYEAAIKDLSVDLVGESFSPEIAYTDPLPMMNPIWIDDLRIQPLDAQMMTYVYDAATLRVLTIFDDQHFGVYYQYNAEGQLIRKMIETERGVKTLQETQYHTPGVPREE